MKLMAIQCHCIIRNNLFKIFLMIIIKVEHFCTSIFLSYMKLEMCIQLFINIRNTNN